MIYNGEPGKQPLLNPVLQPLGVSLLPGTLVQVSKNETPDKIVPYMSMDYSWLVMAGSKRMKAARGGEKGDSLKMMKAGAAGVSYADSGYNLRRLWVSRPKGYVWSKMGHLVTDSVPPVMNEKEEDYKVDSFNIAIAMALPQQIHKKCFSPG